MMRMRARYTDHNQLVLAGDVVSFPGDQYQVFTVTTGGVEARVLGTKTTV